MNIGIFQTYYGAYKSGLSWSHLMTPKTVKPHNPFCIFGSPLIIMFSKILILRGATGAAQSLVINP